MPKRNFTCCISAFVILQIFFYTIEFQFVAIVPFLVILLAQRMCMCLFLTLAVTEHIYCHIDSPVSYTHLHWPESEIIDYPLTDDEQAEIDKAVENAPKLMLPS